jgi:hypothetical protein
LVETGSLNASETLRIAGEYPPGLYILVVVIDGERKMLRLMKL